MVPKTETEPAVTRNGSNSSAERMRRYRERKRQGVVCIVQVPIYKLDAEVLVTRNRLKPEHESHPAKIAEAVEALVDDFTEGKLVPAGDGQRRMNRK